MSQKEPTQGQLQQFVTTLAPISQQVGENVLQALQSAGSVAVLSTVVPGVPTDPRCLTAAIPSAASRGSSPIDRHSAKCGTHPRTN